MTSRETFVHEAQLVLDADDDPRRPGAVVTVELCGHWEHAGPCVVPHHTEARPGPDRLTVRTVFAADPTEGTNVAQRIGRALRGDPSWRVLRTGLAEPEPAERTMARRWI